MKKECYMCHKKIDLAKEKYVLLGTYEKKPLEENYYHFKCWGLYFKQQVSQKLNALASQSMKTVGELVEKSGIFGKQM